MSTQPTIIDDVEPAWVLNAEDGEEPALVPTARLLCECMEQIEWGDLARGYCRCGRLLTVVCGPAEFGASDA